MLQRSYMKKILFLLSAALSLANCSQHYYYAPNTLHLPAVSTQGQVSLEASLNGSSQIKGSELRAAWMPFKKTSVMANYMYLAGSFEQTNFFVFPPPPTEIHTGRGNMLELGITRHFAIPERKSEFVLSSGAGIGGSRNTFDRQKVAKLNFSRYFIQPAFVSHGKFTDLGVGIRLSYLNFYKGMIDYTIEENEVFTIQNIEQKSNFLLPDVGFTAGIRFDPVQIRCNITLALMPQPYQYGFSNHNLSISALSLIDNSSTKKKHKKHKKKNRR